MTYLKPALIVVFLASCLSLSALAAWSFGELIVGGDPDAAVTAANIEAAARLADRTRQRAEADQPLVQELARADLLDPRTIEPRAAASPALKAAAESWQQPAAARDFAKRVAAIAAPPPSLPPGEARKQDAESRRDRLEKFVREEKLAGGKVLEADRVFGLLTAQAGQIDVELKAIDQLSQFVAEVRKVEDDASRASQTESDPEARIARCDKYLADLDRARWNAAALDGIRDTRIKADLAATAAKTARDADRLRRGFQYNRDWWSLRKMAAAAPKPSDAAMLAAFSQFLAKYPAPLAADDRQPHDWVVNRRGELEIRIAVAELGGANNLGAVLDRAESIAVNRHASAEDKQRVRALVVEWLRTRELPPLAAPRDTASPERLEEKQEAVVQDKEGSGARQERLIGFFQAPRGGTLWWQFSKRRPADDEARGDREFMATAFVEKPATPLYVQLADNYNKQLGALLGDVAVREQWETFAARCEELAKQFAAYQTRWSKDANGLDQAAAAQWDFAREAKKARQVLGRWKQFETVMGK